MAGPDYADRSRRRLGLRARSIGIVLAVDVHQRGSGQQREQRERNEYGGQHGDLPVPEQRPCRDVQQTGVQQTRGEPQHRERHRRPDCGPQEPERLQSRVAQLLRPVTAETVAHVNAAGCLT